MALTKETYKGALKTANQLWNRAIARDDKEDIARWSAERNRILLVLANWPPSPNYFPNDNAEGAD